MNILRAPPKKLFLAFLFAGLGVASGAACAEEKTEIAHPFLTHEGLPDAVGSYSTRLSSLATRIDGTTKGDFAFHVETGLTENIGLHLRSDQFLQERWSSASRPSSPGQPGPRAIFAVRLSA